MAGHTPHERSTHHTSVTGHHSSTSALVRVALAGWGLSGICPGPALVNIAGQLAGSVSAASTALMAGGGVTEAISTAVPQAQYLLYGAGLLGGVLAEPYVSAVAQQWMMLMRHSKDPGLSPSRNSSSSSGSSSVGSDLGGSKP